MDTLLQDLRFAVRSLFRQPGFAATALLTLSLGIGASTAIFSVVNTVVLRPLPYSEPERIVAVTNYWTRTGLRATTVSAPDFHDWKAQSVSFETIAYFNGGETSVSTGGSGDYASVFRATPGFFQTFGVNARLGRLLTSEEEKAGGPLAAIITDAYWRRQFGADPNALGATVRFGERTYPIVGILPPGFRYPSRADIYFAAWIVPEPTSRSAHNYRVVAKLKRGTSVQQAQSEMVGIASNLERQYPNSNAAKSIAIVPLQDLIVGDTRNTLYMLLGAVGFVLLIACANVANLLLARSTVRSREMVVRAAVGADRGRLVRQLFTESAVLGLLAAFGGIFLASLGVRALVALAPRDLPRLDEVGLDMTTLIFTVVIALTASLLFGLAPALQASQVQLMDELRQGGKGASTGARTSRARSVFVVAEIALAVVLVAGAGLLGRSLFALAAEDLGFKPGRLLVLRTVVPVSSFAEAPRATAFYRDLLPDLRAVPGVIAAGAVTTLPTVIRSNGGYWIEGGPTPEQTGVRAPQALFTVVTPDYFRTLQIPLRSGRDFTDGDRRDAPFVAVINESLARASFAGEDPIGKRIQCGLDTLDFMTIVGVVADIRTWGPTRPSQPEIYMPYEQHPGPATALNIVARTQGDDPAALTETMRQIIRRRNPDVPVRAETMEATLETASAAPRFRTYLLAVFATVALLLAVAGVYGVMAYTVNQRVPEIGVRMALGAAPADILRLVVTNGSRLAAAGVALGIVLSLATTRAVSGLLFGVTARDPWTLAAVAVGVTIATLAACYVPARRALGVDPMVALRSE